MGRVSSAINIADLHAMARRRTPRAIFDFVEGGVEDEVGLATNAAAFSRIRFLPNYCTDTSGLSEKVEIFGKTFDAPFGIAPTGLNSMFRFNADALLVKAARAENLIFTLSGASNLSLEEAIKIGGDNMWFQLYAPRNRDIGKDLVRRANSAGIKTLVLTVDVPVTGRRERNLRNRLTSPFRPRMVDMIDAAMRPFWLRDYWLNGGMPAFANWAAYAPVGASAPEIAQVFGSEMFDRSQCWNDVEEFRRLWPHKFVLKGILSPNDALRAKQIGVDGIVVSNHGGRQLDRAPASIEMLPEIRSAVGPDMTVILDSGVRRGADIVAARCLGADFVLCGRATLYGVMAGGEEGARRAIWILKEEIRQLLGQIGCADVRKLGPQYIHRPNLTQSAPSV